MRIVALNAAARAGGLTRTMGLAQAQAMLPKLLVRPHDPAADARLLEQLADWADRFTPFVGRSAPDGLMLDITGASHLHGDEAAMQADITGRLAAQGFAVCSAIAGTPGAAWALARYGQSGTIISQDTIAQDLASVQAALAPLPVAALRIDADTAAGLRRAGLKTIGDLIGRPRAPLVARFGAVLVHRLDQARGIDAEAITPRQPIPPAEVEVRLLEPIVREADVSTVARRLAEQLCTLLEARGQGARHLVLSVFRVDGVVRRVEAGTAEACRDAPLLHGLLALRLGHLEDPLDVGYGFDFIRLSATAVGPWSAEAVALPQTETAPASATEQARLVARLVARLGDRLSARFGPEHVWRVSLGDTHIPEHAARLTKVAQRAPSMPLPAAHALPDGIGPLRPLRLFDPPEPIEVIAEVPDGPPLRLRWRRQSLRIAATEGPERIVTPWWSSARGQPSAPPRDYYRIADETGRRLWVYREGLYRHPPDGAAPRWFVHGLFA